MYNLHDSYNIYGVHIFDYVTLILLAVREVQLEPFMCHTPNTYAVIQFC